MDEFATNLTLLLDERGIFVNWLSLVTDHSVNGKLAHDARRSAAMVRHGITNFVTFNRQDFTRFQVLVVQTPAEVLFVAGNQLPRYRFPNIENAKRQFANGINSFSRAIFFCAFLPVSQLSRQRGNSIRKEILLCDTCVASPKKPNQWTLPINPE